MHDITHYVFVDFENVPGVELGASLDFPLHVTLLVGKHQNKMSLALVKDIHALGDRFELVEVGAAGHNALDLTLAAYLGRAIERAPEATFAIVSKDKDFDPMIDHLKAAGISVSRHPSFDTLPFRGSRRKEAPNHPFTAATPKVSAPRKPPTPAKPKPAADKLPKFIDHLRNSPPSNRTKLEHMITAYFKPSLPAGGMKGVIAELIKRNAVRIDSEGKVTCPVA